MSTRRKLQRQHKAANPRQQLPELAAHPATAADGPACPGCGGDGDEEGACGSCGQYFTTCWGSNPDSEDDEAQLHDLLSWDATGRATDGDRCPACT